MSVIINDFEVVVEPPAERGEAAARRTEQAQGEPELTPFELQILLNRQAERKARIRAH